jgi:hypothetical protein
MGAGRAVWQPLEEINRSVRTAFSSATLPF